MVDLTQLAERVVPVLVFLVAITVVAEICDVSGVFDEAAHYATRLARGRIIVLWVLVVVLACLCTILLSLDTTAVLLTPVAIAIATQVGAAPLPFAMATLWLANTASLLLPVSNLTNLLALHRFSQLNVTVIDYLRLMWAPATTAIVLTVALLWLLHRRDLDGHYSTSPRAKPHDRPLMVASAVVAGALGPAFVTGMTPAWPAGIGAAILVAVTAWRAPELLRRISVPWRVALGVVVLFVVVDLALSAGLGPWLTDMVAQGDSGPELLRLSSIAAVTANGINNLPAYLALEITADTSPVRLAALLVGVNTGPIVTIWGSLATILWAQRCRSAGIYVSQARIAVTGLACSVVVVTGATLALAATH